MRKISIITILLVFTLLIGYCVRIGRDTAKSFINDTDLYQYLKHDLKTTYCDMGYDKDSNAGFVDGDKLKSIQGLEKRSIILEGHLKIHAKREIYYECVLSTFIIDKIYGNHSGLKEGDSILFFEPVDCRQKEIDCTDGYNLMHSGAEYIIFAKRLKNAGYGNAKQKYIYAPISTTYGKFQDDDSIPRFFNKSEIENINTAIDYKKVCKEEVFLCDKTKYTKYCRLKKQARTLFH